MTFGQKLKLLREEKSLTVRELGKLFSISRSTISNYENNVRKPDYEMIRKFADYFDVSVDWLLGRVKERNYTILKDDDIPQEIRELGIDYLTVTKELKDKGFTPEEIKKIGNFIYEMREKNNNPK